MARRPRAGDERRQGMRCGGQRRRGGREIRKPCTRGMGRGRRAGDERRQGIEEKSEGGGEISRRFLTIVLVMLASCFILVGLSYYLLNLFSGMVAAPRTPVEEREGRGELLLSLHGELTWMAASMDGRYLAVIVHDGEPSGELLVLDLEEGCQEVWSRRVRGDRACWAGYSPLLVFEDGGDLLSLDLEHQPPEPTEITAGPEYDEDPLPSPDGHRLLFKSFAGRGGGEEFKVLLLGEGGEPLVLGPGEEPAAWDPTGTRLICMAPTEGSLAREDAKTMLQEADVRSGAWVDRHLCEEDARYLWWPETGAFLYVAPYTSGGERRAVWFEVRPSGEEEKRFSTDGLEEDFSWRFFYPERSGTRLAYRGVKGLEILDIRRGVIVRYPQAGSTGAPLAWREGRGEILWWEPGGIYRLSLD